MTDKIDYWAKYNGKINLNSKQRRFNFIMDYIESASETEDDNGDGGE